MLFRNVSKLEKRRSGRLKSVSEQYLMWCPYKTGKISKYLTQNLRDAFGPSVDLSVVGWRFIRNGVKKPFLRKGNGEKRLRYDKWHKKWTEYYLEKLQESLSEFNLKNKGVIPNIDFKYVCWSTEKYVASCTIATFSFLNYGTTSSVLLMMTPVMTKRH